jgi:hypothetical protein
MGIEDTFNLNECNPGFGASHVKCCLETVETSARSPSARWQRGSCHLTWRASPLKWLGFSRMLPLDRALCLPLGIAIARKVLLYAQSAGRNAPIHGIRFGMNRRRPYGLPRSPERRRVACKCPKFNGSSSQGLHMQTRNKAPAGFVAWGSGS